MPPSIFLFGEMAEGMDVNIDRDQYEALAQQFKDIVGDLAANLPQEEVLLAIYGIATEMLDALTRDIDCACKTGCSHCCYQPVSVHPYDLVALVKAIDALPPGRRRPALAGLRKLTSVPLGQRLARGFAKANRCPLLGRDGRCQVYEGRPLSCRFYLSLSEEACRKKLADNSYEFKCQASSLLTVTLIRRAIDSALSLQYGVEAVTEHEMADAVLAALNHAGQSQDS